MKIIRYVLMMWVLLGMASCVKDDSTDGTGAISEILIEEGSIRDLYDIDKNQVLTITPKCKQTNMDKPLSYTWEINQDVYSTTPEFVYTGDRLGTYKCRLIVQNEDGKTFFPFTLNVNSPYEEGITVLSHDAQGKSMLSFMLKQRVTGVEDHFEDGDCFALNNPDMTFAPNVSDVVQCDGNLIISCQGNPTEGIPPAVYYLNEKTFVVQNHINVPEYPNFKPIKLGVPKNGYAGSAYPILCEDGSIYEISIAENVVIPSARLPFNYAQTCEVSSGSGAGQYVDLFWDEEHGGLCMLVNGYGPYYCSKTYNLSVNDMSESTNYFNGAKFIGMFLPRQPLNTPSTESPTVVVVTSNTSGVISHKVMLKDSFWSYNADKAENVLVDNGGKSVCSTKPHKFNARSPQIASQLYYTLFFSENNQVYAWNYTTSQKLSDAKTYCTPGTADAVVTSMELSQDQQELFVAFYEPNESGLNGHVWVYDTQEGRLLRQYDNVCYRPAKIIYKKK